MLSNPIIEIDLIAHSQCDPLTRLISPGGVGGDHSGSAVVRPGLQHTSPVIQKFGTSPDEAPELERSEST